MFVLSSFFIWREFMELIFTIAVGLLLLLVVVSLLAMTFAWVAHTIFGLDSSWLDYGISEDDM